MSQPSNNAILKAIQNGVTVILTKLEEIEKHMSVNQQQLNADLQVLKSTVQGAAADITSAFIDLKAKIVASGAPIDFTAEDALVTQATAALQALDVTAKSADPGAPSSTPPAGT
jgi:hypothetical protein